MGILAYFLFVFYPITVYPTLAMNALKKSILSVGAGLLLSASVHAASQVQTLNFSFPSAGSQELTFNYFDFDSGDVESITIQIHATVSGGKSAGDNDSTDPGSYSYTDTFEVKLYLDHSGSGFALFDKNANAFNTTPSNTSLVSSAFTVGTVTEDDGDGATFEASGTDYFEINHSLDPIADSAELSSIAYNDYLGSSGTFTITVFGMETHTISSSGSFQKQSDPSTTSGTLTITVVPEPSSAALLAGLSALFWMALRRRELG